MIELNILGPAEIRNSRGELEHSFLAGPKRLALLTFLLLARPRGFHRRDSLLPLFWPELDQKSARNSLSNMLYHIRKTLGSEALKNRGAEEIMIDPQVFSSDVLLFEQAIKRQDLENALELYRSDLLKGFFVSNNSQEFDHWLEKERKRFHSLATDGCRSLAIELLRNNEHQEAQKWLKKGLELNPDSEDFQIKLISSLGKTGNKKAALETYREFCLYLQKEYNEEPGQRLKELVAIISNGNKNSLVAPEEPAPVPASKSSEKSIAVLPFEDLSITKLHFAEGIHGDILTALSRIKDLQVISRTSVKNLLKSLKRAPQIGKELGVNWLLEGEVQQVENEIRINVRLINAPEDSQAWSQSYQKQLTTRNLFTIRDEVANDILETLKIKLSPGEKIWKDNSPTFDLEAYRMYSLGKSNLDLRTEEGIYTALDFFKGSIELDSNYALAWAGWADALSLLNYYGLPTPRNTPSSLSLASKAVELNPRLGEAHCSMGIAYSIEQNGPAAKESLQAAIKFSPSYAEAHIWLGWVNVMMGKAREALEVSERAVKYNPLSPSFRIFLSIIYLANNKYTEALREAKRAREINPDYSLTHYVEGLSEYHLGKYEAAISSLEQILPQTLPFSTPSRAEVQIVMAYSYQALGNEEYGRNLKEEIHSRINPFPAAMLQILHGDLDAAFESLDRVQTWGSFSAETLRYFFPEELKGLRNDKRYSKLIAKVDRSWRLP